MKRKGRCGSTDESCRETCRMLAPDVEPARLESGGMYVPVSRKDLMLVMRSREDAEGERSMIGSGRRPGFLSRKAGLALIGVAVVGPLSFFLSLMNVSECLRM